MVGLEPLDFFQMGLTEFGLFVESFVLSLLQRCLMGQLEFVDSVLVAMLDLLKDENLSFRGFSLAGFELLFHLAFKSS